MLKVTCLFAAICLLLSGTFIAGAQNFKLFKKGYATPKNKKVLLLKDESKKNSIILFQTNLRVNTDGSPLSYHPQDPKGETKAINNLCNAIVVKKRNSDKNLCRSNYREAINIFNKWRDSDYITVRSGYTITWNNVLSAVKTNGKSIPCVFKTGVYKGYFGSLTALKNGVIGDKGECEINNQVNPMTVPALVLLGGQNIVKDFGAKVGDLLVAYDPENQIFISAIIGDIGPKDNLGEGSIYLNMKLLNKNNLPKNKSETYKLSIENTKILIAIIPNSSLFDVENKKPFTASNIDQRVKNWQKKAGFSTPQEFFNLIKVFQTKLN